jgi:uncharacterized protein (TIGR03435 family)
VAAPLIIGMAGARPIRAQQAPGGLTFEVASVKPNASKDIRNSSMRLQGGGRITITGTPLFRILMAAYRIPGMFNTPRLSGGPDWIRQEAFDIEAVAPAGAVTPEMTVEERDARVRQMLLALLKDRFKLQVRHESKDAPVYAVTVSKSGLKLKKSSVSAETCRSQSSDSGPGGGPPAGAPCHRIQGGLGRGLHGQAVTMADIATTVENWSDRPVIDQTDLKDALFEVDTEGWVPLLAMPRGEGPEAEALRDPARPTLFQVFDKMGLKLEPKRGPVDIYIIEHAEKPAAN